MSHKKKSWQESLSDRKGFPKVLKLEKRFPCYNAVHKWGAEAGDRVVLVNPSEIVEIMKRVPEGRLITIVEICKKIAKKYKVEACCSLTTGIFIRDAANAAEEAASHGEDIGIPYWRILKSDGFLNDKYPGGIEAQKRLLESEGHEVVQRGKRYLIADYEKSLMKI